jgi:hypothetical protein
MSKNGPFSLRDENCVCRNEFKKYLELKGAMKWTGGITGFHIGYNRGEWEWLDL